MSTHEFEMNINGEIIRWAEKSHAQIFRNFWQFFMEKDLQKTIETIEFTGIRISDSEYFVAKNGSKKKNIFVKDNYYVYTHLTPSAMQKAYEKFKKGWEEYINNRRAKCLTWNRRKCQRNCKRRK